VHGHCVIAGVVTMPQRDEWTLPTLPSARGVATVKVHRAPSLLFLTISPSFILVLYQSLLPYHYFGCLSSGARQGERQADGYARGSSGAGAAAPSGDRRMGQARGSSSRDPAAERSGSRGGAAYPEPRIATTGSRTGAPRQGP
jgi:hypothetical protein